MMLDPRFESILLNTDLKNLSVTKLVKHIKELKTDLPETHTIEQIETNKKHPAPSFIEKILTNERDSFKVKLNYISSKPESYKRNAVEIFK